MADFLLHQWTGLEILPHHCRQLIFLVHKWTRLIFYYMSGHAWFFSTRMEATDFLLHKWTVLSLLHVSSDGSLVWGSWGVLLMGVVRGPRTNVVHNNGAPAAAYIWILVERTFELMTKCPLHQHSPVRGAGSSISAARVREATISHTPLSEVDKTDFSLHKWTGLIFYCINGGNWFFTT